MKDEENKEVVEPAGLLDRLRIAMKVLRADEKKGDPVFPRSQSSNLYTLDSNSFGGNLSFSTFRGSTVDYVGEVGELTSSSLCMAVWQYIGTSLAEAPPIVRVFGKNDTEGELVPDHPLVALLKQPNDFYDGATLLQAFALDWLFSGDVYWIKVRDKKYLSPIQLWYVPYFMMAPYGDDNDRTVFIKEYMYIVDGKRYPYPKEDVVQFRRGINPRDLRRGIGVFDSVLREIYTDQQASNFSAAILKNWGIVPFVLSPPKNSKPGSLTSAFGDDPEAAREQAMRIKATFMEATTGDHRGEPIVNTIPLEITKLAFSPAELDISSLRKIPESRIAAVSGLPAALLQFLVGLEHGTSYASYKEAREQAYESVIVPLLKTIAAGVNKHLMSDFGDAKGRRLEFDFDLSKVRVLQDDQDKLFTRADAGIQSGWLLVSDARSMVGLRSDGTDDVYLRAEGPVPKGRPLPPLELPKPEPPPPPQLIAAPADAAALALAAGKKPKLLPAAPAAATSKMLQLAAIKLLLDTGNGNGNGHSNGHSNGNGGNGANGHKSESDELEQMIRGEIERELLNEKFNPNHDEIGRFAEAQGGGGASGFTAGIDLDKRLVDYKPDRSLSDPAQTQPLVSLMNTPFTGTSTDTRFEPYSQMPFIDALHAQMGVRDASKIPIEKYVQLRDKFFSALPVSDVPLDNIVVTQAVANIERVHEIREHPETVGGKHPYLVRYDGETYVINGHHRIAAEVLDYHPVIKGHVWDLGWQKDRKYSPDQLRDDHGRWTGGGSDGGGSAHEPGSPEFEQHLLGMENYLRAVSEMTGRMSRPGYKYRSIEQLVWAEGEVFKAGPLPKGISNAKLGLCYMNAYRVADSHPELEYVEGFAESSKIGIPLAHAWTVTKDGVVVDPTWDRMRKRGETIVYYGVRIPIETVRMTILARGRYGVLDNPEQGFPHLRTGLQEKSSGNFGHVGRPGQVGGSGPSGSAGHLFTEPIYGVNDTRGRFQNRKTGKYPASRRHKEIMQFFLKHGIKVDSPEVLFLGGGTAAGKSTFIAYLEAKGRLKGLVTSNPDEIKALIKEYKELVAKGDRGASAMVHQEGSDVAKELVKTALESKFSVLSDTTGDSSLKSLTGKLERMRSLGATSIHAEYSFCNVTTAMQRAEHRGSEGGSESGRFVHPRLVRNSHISVANVFPAALKRGLFDTAKLWNTDTKPPVLVATFNKKSGLSIRHRGLWLKFKAIGRMTPSRGPARKH